MEFEYKVLENPTQTTLNLLGKDNWDLISVVSRHPTGNLVAFLKREYVKKEKTDPIAQMILEEETQQTQPKTTKKSTKPTKQKTK